MNQDFKSQLTVDNDASNSMDSNSGPTPGAQAYLYLAGGIALTLFGLIFLIWGRKVIKLLYFFSGFKFFAYLSGFIGVLVLASKLDELNSVTPILILFGSALGIGLVGAILAVYFGKFGLVLLGLGAGFDLWGIFRPFVKSGIANLVLSIVFAIAFAIICFKNKRPMEILISCFTGANNFVSGLFYIIWSVLMLTKAPEKVVNEQFPVYGGIGLIVVFLGIFIGSFCHHYSEFKEARLYEHQPVMSEV